MDGMYKPRGAGRAATGRDVPGCVVHGVLPNLGCLTTATPPEGLCVARVREVSLCLHLPRSINHDGEPAALVDAEVGALESVEVGEGTWGCGVELAGDKTAGG